MNGNSTDTIHKAPRLLVIDDEKIALRNLVHIFKKEGYEVVGKQTGSSGLKAIENERFDVVVTDLRMEKVDGMEILHRARELYPDIEVIVITGHATITSAVDAMKEGAFQYIAKPFRLDEVRHVVKEALKLVQLRHENSQLRKLLDGYQGNIKIITQHIAMQRLLETARQVAPTDCNILISGESGTGKELLARYIHIHSARHDGPFLAVNCGAFNEDLLANELFGHEKGAYTGAGETKRGLIEMAAGGTLFLDEVTEMSPSMQVKLLRVTQEKEVLRIGATKPIKVDVRYLASTNRNIHDMVADGDFRQDLYYRLNVVNLHLPSLRERRDDIALLSHFFLRKHAELMNKQMSDIDPEVMAVLTRYDFPGNVRELENIIERGVALASGPILSIDYLPTDLRDLNIKVFQKPTDVLPTLESQESEYIKWVLEQTKDNRTQAAKILGIDRVSLWRKMKKYGLAD